MLQSEALDLAGAILVGATLKTLNDYRNKEKYMQISDNAKELADSLNIPVMESQRRSHRTRTPSFRLRDMIVLESTDDRTFEGKDVDKATYFAVIDKFIVEIKARFNDSEHILLAIAACNPKVANFLDLKVLTPLITHYSLDLCKLKNELPVAEAAIANAKDLQLGTIADIIQFFIPMKLAFSELLKMLQLALTIPVTSASCERSFSSLKRIKTYLRSRMGNERLSNIAVLAIEREATNVIDLERVVDIFAEKNRTISLKC